MLNIFSAFELIIMGVGIVTAIAAYYLLAQEAHEEGREFHFWDMFRIYEYEEVEEEE